LSATARALAVTAGVVGLDQATKALVRANVERGSSDSIFPLVDLVHVHNRGVAFGLLSGGGAVLIAVAAVGIAALLVFFVTHRGRPYVWLPVGLLLGGAAGNLIDRAARGYVTDFIDLPLWPAFNIADVAITFGVLALLYVLEGPPKRDEAAHSPA
jgi:signal peptidase II